MSLVCVDILFAFSIYLFPQNPDQPLIGRDEDRPDQQSREALRKTRARRGVHFEQPRQAPSAIPLRTGELIHLAYAIIS